MSKLIPVVYVGRKPIAFDNVSGSGKTWQGKGDVQEVTDVQARILTKYPDQWELVNKADAAIVARPQSLQVTDGDGNDVAVDPDDLKKPLERMTRPELKAYAFNRWGKNLDARQPTKLMIDQIEEWEKELGLVKLRSAL